MAIPQLTKMKNPNFTERTEKWSNEFSQLNKLINNSNVALALLDGLEDQRRLSALEKKFRQLVKRYLPKLLESKRI
jgi:hypothetical protein